MPFRYLAGEKFNLAARGTLTVSDQDVNYQPSWLVDGDPGRPFLFGSAGADRMATIDLNEITDSPGFEVASLAGWTAANTGTGTSVETLVGAEVHSGTRALKVGGGASGVGARYKDFIVRAGETRAIEVWMRGDATVAAKAKLQNLHNGDHLKSDGTWQAAAVDFASEVGSTYVKKTVNGYVVAGGLNSPDLVTLRLTLYADGNGFGYLDDVRHYAARWNFVSIHGHNLGAVVVEAHSSNDGFAANDTTELTLAKIRPAFYGITGADVVNKGWVRLKLAGSNIAVPQIGELVVGDAQTLAQGMNRDWVLGYMEDHESSATLLGRKDVTVRTQERRRLIRGQVDNRSLASFQQFRDSLYGRGEAFPLVVAPGWNETSDADVVIHGHFEGEVWEVGRPFPLKWPHSWTIVEDPFYTALP